MSGKKRRFRRFLKNNYNFFRWMDASYLKDIFHAIVQLFRSLFVVKKAQREESFDQALHRYSIDKIRLDETKQKFRNLAYFFALISAAIFIYALYCLHGGSLRAALFSTVLALIALTQFFRFHFWRFQLEKGQLGCTFGEWLREGLLKQKELDDDEANS